MLSQIFDVVQSDIALHSQVDLISEYNIAFFDVIYL